MADKQMPAFLKGKKGKSGTQKPMKGKKMGAKGGKEMVASKDPMGKKVNPFAGR